MNTWPRRHSIGPRVADGNVLWCGRWMIPRSRRRSAVGWHGIGHQSRLQDVSNWKLQTSGSPLARFTPGSPATRPATTGAPFCGVVGNGGIAPEDPQELARRSGIARKSLKRVRGWAISRAIPCSDQATADSQHLWIASHVTRSWPRSDRSTRTTCSRRSVDA